MAALQRLSAEPRTECSDSGHRVPRDGPARPARVFVRQRSTISLVCGGERAPARRVGSDAAHACSALGATETQWGPLRRPMRGAVSRLPARMCKQGNGDARGVGAGYAHVHPVGRFRGILAPQASAVELNVFRVVQPQGGVFRLTGRGIDAEAQRTRIDKSCARMAPGVARRPPRLFARVARDVFVSGRRTRA